MKLFAKNFNYWWLLLLLFLTPVIVFAVGSAYTGYRAYKNNTTQVVYWNENNDPGVMSRSVTGFCIKNNSATTDYFIPTRTLSEFESFYYSADTQVLTDLEILGCPGDGVCGVGETCASVPADCGTCPGCGDGECNNGETGYISPTWCPFDCPPVCGDGECTPATYYSSSGGSGVLPGESCGSCPRDCGACAVCGDHTCETGKGEKCGSVDSGWACKTDCGYCNCSSGSDCTSNEYCTGGSCSGQYYSNQQWLYCDGYSWSQCHGSCTWSDGGQCFAK